MKNKLSFSVLKRLYIDCHESRALTIKVLSKDLNRYINNLENDIISTDLVIDNTSAKNNLNELKNFYYVNR